MLKEEPARRRPGAEARRGGLHARTLATVA
jgi:hypothetical protein